MSKVMTFIDWYTPAYKAGGPTRSVRNIVEAIGDKHEFYVVTGSNDFNEDKDLEGIEIDQWVTKGNTRIIYLSHSNRTESNYQKLFSEIQPDYIYLNSLFSTDFTLKPLRSFKNHKNKIVLAPRGMLGVESLKIKATKKKVFLAVSKLIGLYRDITWHATNDIEKDLILRQFGSKTRIKIAPNLPFITKEEVSWIRKEKGHLQLLSVSRIVPIKNILLLLRALKEARSEINLVIVGPNEDEAYWKECLEVMNNLPVNVSVDYIGQVIPEQMGEYYKNCHAYVSPTLNENYGHSIVEALGYGCPVIISDKTPWRNLEEKRIGFDLKLDKDHFLEKIEFFASMSEGDFNEYRESARDFANKELINENLLDKSSELFKN